MAGVAIHTISFKGFAGIMFCFHCCAWFFFALAYATPYWSKSAMSDSFVVQGIWESGRLSHTDGLDVSWYKGVQAIITIALICLFVCLILVTLYMCVHRISKNGTIIALVIMGFVAFAAQLVGIILYGVKATDPGRLGWSFGFAIIGAGFTLAGTIFSLLQLRASGVSN